MKSLPTIRLGAWLGVTLVLAGQVLAAPVTPIWEMARVTRVIDGNTYEVLTGGQVLRVRLLSVDAPEHDQAFGPQATDSATALLRGRLVRLQRHGLDLYTQVAEYRQGIKKSVRREQTRFEVSDPFNSCRPCANRPLQCTASSMIYLL